MQDLSDLLGACRIVAQFFLDHAFRAPLCRTNKNMQLSDQVTENVPEKESHIINAVRLQVRWQYYTCAFVLGGVDSWSNAKDTAFFAKQYHNVDMHPAGNGFDRLPVIRNPRKRVAWTGSLATSPDWEIFGKQAERSIKSKRDDSARGLGGEIQERLCSSV